MSRTILGLGGILSDAACCVIHEGALAAAIEQAKVSPIHRPGEYPGEAVQSCLQTARISATDVQCIAVARPFSRSTENVAFLNELRVRCPQAEIVVVEHHAAHAASAYYLSGFEKATVLTLDRAGDVRSATLWRANANELTAEREMYFPDSLGDIFSRVTGLLGFEPRADEHKVQWLSTAAEPVYANVFVELLHRQESGWPRLDRSFLDAGRLTQGGFSSRFFERLGLENAAEISEARKAEIAASLQHAISETVTGMIGSAENVCLAGGLGLNALLVAFLERQFPHAFVQPAAGNAGTAVGAALHAWHNFYHEQRRIPFETLCLGPSYEAEQVKRVLENCKLRFRYILTGGDLIETALTALNQNKIIAWMHGRTEFGPRALGNRSILASPLNPYSTENLNTFIKHREKFRKFAASVPAELADQYFEVGSNARFLATVGRVRPEHRRTFESAILGRDLIRVHTVSKSENPLYHALLTAAGEATGLPVLYNTSFNLFGHPLVCTPRDAVRSFYSSGIDAMFVGHFYLEK